MGATILLQREGQVPLGFCLGHTRETLGLGGAWPVCPLKRPNFFRVVPRKRTHTDGWVRHVDLERGWAHIGA